MTVSAVDVSINGGAATSVEVYTGPAPATSGSGVTMTAAEIVAAIDAQLGGTDWRTAGADGQSAYALAVALGYTGTDAEWIASLKGATGAPGTDGADGRTILSGTTAPTADNGADGDYWIDAAALVIYGPKASGAWPEGQEMQGDTGQSAYALAAALGYTGTEAEWVASLKGATGEPGTDVQVYVYDSDAADYVQAAAPRHFQGPVDPSTLLTMVEGDEWFETES